jgi:putative membrane protein
MLIAGTVVLTAALGPPLHEAAETLFWAHMMQHELIVAVAAPLVVLGAPVATLVRAFPTPLREMVSTVARNPGVSTIARAATHPAAASLVHAATILVWHVPSLYGQSVDSAGVHALQHTTFLLSGLMFWSAMLRPRRRTAVLASPLWLFGMATLTGGLGALLVLAPMPLYPVYAAIRSSGLTPLEDQQIAGIIMWMPGTVAYLVAAVLLLARLLSADPSPHATLRSPAPRPSSTMPSAPSPRVEA